MAEREALISDFLDGAGWGRAERRRLAGDASFRSYERLFEGGRTSVLMDAPPGHEDVRPFARIARHLSCLGLSAPEILAENAEHGLLLLEDLGDDTYTRLLAGGGGEKALYALAVDVLIHIHQRPALESVPGGLAPYDDEKLLDEAHLLTDWYMPAVFGEATPDDIRHSYAEAWLGLFPIVHAGPRTLVLRDFHVDNLMALAGREGVKACGLLDFQDAVAGHPAYDLMSLLEDARRDIGPELAGAMLGRYHAAFAGRDRDAFDSAYAVLAVQRHAKVVGIFTRLSVRDGKADYLVHIPRVWRLLERALEHQSLAALAGWLDRHLPKDKRGIPPCPPAAQ